MKRTIRLFVGLTILVASSAATAGPLYLGTFDLISASNHPTEPHGIWFNQNIFVSGVGAYRFDLDPGTTFTASGNDIDGYTANLSGSATSAVLGGGFSFNVNFDYLCTGCNSGDPLGQVTSPPVNPDEWDYYLWENSTEILTGIDSLAGFDLTISIRPDDNGKPFRFGIGADWFNDNTLGGSGWFDVDDMTYVTDVYTNASRGDFNIRAVPEPGTLGLLGVGLLGLAFARRKKAA